MTKAKERKLKLVTMIGFAVLSVSALTVSTFAWFTTRNKATFQTGTMVIDSVDDFDFYAYKGNPDDSYVPEEEIEEDVFNKFDDDFIHLGADDSQATKDHYLSLNGMYPGKAMTFAFKTTKSSFNVSISKITSNDADREGITYTSSGQSYTQHRYVNGKTNMEVNVGWAMNVYVQVFTADSGYSSFVTNPSNDYTATDLFRYDELSETADYHRASYLAGSEDTNSHVVTLTNPIPLYSGTSLTGTNYVIISVLFSDHKSTYFQEVDGTSGTAKPVDTIPTMGDRYFKQSDSGSSNCYSNLTFALNELKLG